MNYAIEGSNRMKVMINDLLQFSRVDSRGKPFQQIGMEGVLGMAIQNLQEVIKETQADISRDALPDVFADEGQLVELMQNLLANAIKFRGTETPKIHIGVQDNREEWLFSVKDNGIGMDQQFNERIFIIFQRLHTREEYPGSGIGLSISKRIAERHGGKLWVESQLGKGSTFYFTIPQKRSNGNDS
jgi:light-regulated signal transduction histidine kinase (bacteriophytochrome)